jgi:hypothetical protein
LGANEIIDPAHEAGAIWIAERAKCHDCPRGLRRCAWSMCPRPSRTLQFQFP